MSTEKQICVLICRDPVEIWIACWLEYCYAVQETSKQDIYQVLKGCILHHSILARKFGEEFWTRYPKNRPEVYGLYEKATPIDYKFQPEDLIMETQSGDGNETIWHFTVRETNAILLPSTEWLKVMTEV